jgi:dinuclear metal center YbgI/SA1388 family protein
MKVADLVQVLESLAPTRYAEPWDNVGLLIGDAQASLSHVLLTIDLGPDELEEARGLGCEAVVAYHPPIFKNVRRLLPGMPAYEAVRAGIAVFSPHTALDVAQGGTNDALAHEVLGMVEVEPLRATAEGPGMGRVGVFEPPQERAHLLERIKQALGVDNVLIAGPRTGKVRAAAVCAGSCGDLLEDALQKKVDLYLTGEMRHHDALHAAREGLTVVCALHSNSERHVLTQLRTRLVESLPGLAATVSERDSDPFTIC